MIRVAGLAGQVQRGIERLSIDGRTPLQQLAAVRERVARLSLAQDLRAKDRVLFFLYIV